MRARQVCSEDMGQFHARRFICQAHHARDDDTDNPLVHTVPDMHVLASMIAK